MSDQNALEIIRRQERLAADRAPFEREWREIAEYVAPLRAGFEPHGDSDPPGRQRFDGTAGMAAENLAAGLWGAITNSATSWFSLRHADEALNEDVQSKAWLETATGIMREAFAAGGMRFYGRAVDLYADLVTFGTGVFYVDDADADGRLFFTCRHLAECFVAEDERERIDTVHRRFEWTARQAARRWGKALPPRLMRAAEKEPERRFPFIHAVMPREDYEPRRRDAKGLPFASVYVDVDSGTVIAESGYAEFPYQVPRWSTRARRVYGDSPAMLALADARMLNAMSKTTLVAAQKAADPPLLVPDEAALRGIRVSPGGIIYGGVDQDGRALYQPLATGGSIGLGLELEDRRRQAIRDAFYASLLLMVPEPGRTATEVLARQEEKMTLLAPHLGRVQSEFLDPLIDRVFRALARAGAFPPMPRVLMKSGRLKVDYVSPLARAQRAGEGTAVTRTLEALAPLAAADPGVFDNFDADQLARTLADAFGLPSRSLRPMKAVETLRADRAAAAMPQMPELPMPPPGGF